MIGQDDVILKRDRSFTCVAESEVFTLRLEKEHFDKMIKEFPEIREELLEEANLRSHYVKIQK